MVYLIRAPQSADRPFYELVHTVVKLGAIYVPC